MDFSAPHAGFVIASYLVTFVVLLGLVLATWLRQRKAREQLETLEKRGSRRRRRAENNRDSA